MKRTTVLMVIICFSSLLLAQSQWQIIQSPTSPLIYSIDNVFFLTPNEGWIAGSAGSTTPTVILHTVDAGQTWEVQYYQAPGSDTSFNAIRFLDSNIGWVVGNAGLIWKTVDGGLTWTDQSPGTITADLQAISPVNANVVYVSGNSGAILKSIDGGASWINQSLTATSNLHRIHAFNENTAFAMSNSNDGYIFSTTDGGTTWNTINAPFPGPGISLRQYDCVGLPNGTAYIAGYHGTVFKSTDYGVSWTNVANIFGATLKIFYSIGAFGDHVWCGDSNGKLYYSSNGGTSWDTLLIRTKNVVEYIKAFSDNHLYIYCTYGQLWESTDAGQNFTPLISWPNLSWWDMVATSNKIFLGSISGGEMTVSENNGQSWTYPLSPVPGQYGGINDIFFLDDNLGFYCGQDGTVGKTTDGGQTWALKQTSYGFASNKTYNFIFFKDALNGFTGGSSAIIQRTTDGGETWTEGTLPNSAVGYDCYFIDANTGIISASSGKILRTVDGGSTWTEVIDFGSQTMRCIEFIDNTTGFICASSGYLFKTTDGGSSWVQAAKLVNVNLPADEPDLYRIEFVNSTTGYICGEDGTLFKTTDGGNTWEQQVLPSEISEWTLQAMTWIDENTGFIAGQNGYILCSVSSTVPSPLIINEVMWDVPQDNPATPTIYEGDANGDGFISPRADEFIELVNTGTEPLDIGGYQIKRRAGHVIFTFPAGVVLNPNEITVVFGGVGPGGFGGNFPPTLQLFAAKPGQADSGFADPTSTDLQGAGDNVVVVNSSLNAPVAEIYWGTAAPLSSGAIKTEPPNTVGNKIIQGDIAQSVTRNPDITGLWDLHSEATSGILYSPGANKDNPYLEVKGDSHLEEIPSTFRVYQNYPNPFNPETTFKLDLPRSTQVSITIYNTLGQVVRTLYHGDMNAGTHSFSWDSRNDYGLPSPSGIYFYKVQAGDYSSMNKMILMK